MIVSKNMYCLLFVFFMLPLMARDIILEFKGAYFLSTSSDFKDIYGNGGALYGPEVTVQLCGDTDWFFFASIDYLRKKGHSVGLCNKTTIKLVPLAFGIKYLKTVHNGDVDLYAGLGLQAVNARTKNCSNFVLSKDSQWGLGGIAKVGAYYYLPHKLVLDFFIDYSFVKVGSNDCNCAGVQSVKANLSGAIFGVGLGYHFY